jgi:hypothetical protein
MLLWKLIISQVSALKSTGGLRQVSALKSTGGLRQVSALKSTGGLRQVTAQLITLLALKSHRFQKYPTISFPALVFH